MGKARRKLLESSRGIVPYPCSPPAHGGSRGPRPGSRFWFPPHPSASPAARDPGSRGNLSGCLTAKPKSSLAPGAAAQPGATSGIWLEKPLRVPWKCPGPCPAGEPRLSTAQSCAQGSGAGRGEPRARGGAGPGAAPMATAPRCFPAAFVLSANLYGSTKVVFPVGPGQPRLPALLEGPRPPMLLTRPAALPMPSRARRPSRLEGPRSTPGPSPAEFQSSLEMFRVLFSGHICMNPEIPFGMYETSTGATPTDSV